MDPEELARRARRLQHVSAEESSARHAARGLRLWWNPARTVLHLHGQVPDEMGARLEQTIHTFAEQLRPVKGQVWDTREHRYVDALLALCDHDADDSAPPLTSRPNLQVSVPLTGPAEIAGIPIADTLLEQLRASATVEPVLVDEAGAVLHVGKRTSALSPKIARAVLLRDAKCRVPGCRVRHGLEIHHLQPRSWAAPTRSPTSPACAPDTTAPSSPTAAGRSPATPTNPTDSPSSNAHHPAPDPPPRERGRARQSRFDQGVRGCSWRTSST
jgi:hypothetical protein